MAEVARHTPTGLRQAYRYKVQHRLHNPMHAKILLRIWCEQEPTSGSSVSLSGTRDSLVMLRTRLDWQISDRELATMRCYIQSAAHALQGLATLQPDRALMDGTGDFRERCDDCNHHMGGMRMSPCESSGVVDTNLRLFGTANTYVCSSAVFPTSGYSNPTHTVLALVVRLADHLTLETPLKTRQARLHAAKGRTMEMIRLPVTGRQTTQLGLGCGSVMGVLGWADSTRLLETAFHAGIRHFDVAPAYGYGEAERCLGAFLARHPGEVTVTTKFGIPPASSTS